MNYITLNELARIFLILYKCSESRGTGASWIEIELAKRVMVDSLLITTSPKNWIKELTVNITEEDVTVPKIKVFYSSPDTLTEPYQRILRFPQPYVFER